MPELLLEALYAGGIGFQWTRAGLVVPSRAAELSTNKQH